MSTKQLRAQLRAKEEAAAAGSDSGDDEPIVPQTQRKNAFELLNELSGEEEEGEAKDNSADESAKIGQVPSSAAGGGGNINKKKKNRKKKQKKAAESAEAEDDSFEAIIEKYGSRPEQPTATDDLAKLPADASTTAFGETDLFKVDFRKCDPDAEMRAILGAKFKISDSAAGGRRRLRVGTRLVIPRQNWPPFKQIGLDMKLSSEEAGGVRVFEFVHQPAYRDGQYMFWAAADSLDHNAFMEILRVHPYHVDSLIQMAAVTRTNEDWQTARALVERAVFACEASLHSQFNLSTFNCRLDYRKWENRPFFLALFKHINGLCERSLFKTALEFSKALYSLAPSDDPLGVMLLIDYVALRARAYDYLLTLTQTLDVSRNILELPNFAFSSALARFKQHQEGGGDDDALLDAADEALQLALIKFPTVLPALLDVCSVQPDAQVDKCAAFSLTEQCSDGKGLQQLIKLFVCRAKPLWIERDVLDWLQVNVQHVIPSLNEKENPTYRAYREKRQKHYPRIPRSVLRHILIADITPVVSMLETPEPHQLGFDYDPLPPADSWAEYSRPQAHRPRGQDGMLTAFFRSLLPNYDMEALALQQEADARAAQARGDDPQPAATVGESFRDMLDAVRTMMQQVHFEPAPGAQPGQPDEADFEEADWEDM